MAELTDLKGLTLNKRDDAISRLFNKNLSAGKDSFVSQQSSKRRVVVIKKDHIIAKPRSVQQKTESGSCPHAIENSPHQIAPADK